MKPKIEKHRVRRENTHERNIKDLFTQKGKFCYYLLILSLFITLTALQTHMTLFLLCNTNANFSHYGLINFPSAAVFCIFTFGKWLRRTQERVSPFATERTPILYLEVE